MHNKNQEKISIKTENKKNTDKSRIKRVEKYTGKMKKEL